MAAVATAKIACTVFPLLAFLPAAATANRDRGPEPELTIREDRAGMLRNDVPYRGIGINYFDVFYHLLRDPEDHAFIGHFQRLRELGIPFVRFAANGFWPKDNALYFRDKQAYFALLDRVVDAAEQSGLGLVPSLFWNIATVPDMVAEPLSALGNSRSRTRRFIQTYTEEVVRRYRSSRAIWMWELGNEYNDHVDLPPAPRFRPQIVTELGTPSYSLLHHWNCVPDLTSSPSSGTSAAYRCES